MSDYGARPPMSRSGRPSSQSGRPSSGYGSTGNIASSASTSATGAARPGSRTGLRTSAGGMPMGVQMRAPGTAVRGTMPGTAMVPGTAMRRGVGGAGGALASQIQVGDRPLTQQGLTGLKTGSQGPQRMVQDKTFYLGQLRAKSNELLAEINRLNGEIESYNRDNSSYLTYEKRADGLARELKDPQGQLGDYNTLMDKINTEANMDDIVHDHVKLAQKNDREEKMIDDVFTERSEKEHQIKKIEDEIEAERRSAESLVSDLDPEKRRLFFRLREENDKLLNDLRVRQEELDKYTEKAKGFEEELRMDRYKQMAVNLHDKIRVLKEKRDEIKKEVDGTAVENVPEERERLLAQVKEDNNQIASMEKKISEMQDKIKNANDIISQLDIDLDEHKSEANAKYHELLKRDREMQSFLDTYDETRKGEAEKKSHLEQNIVALLEHISRNMSRSKQMPSVDGLRAMRDDLMTKEKEMNNSQNTVAALDSERERLQGDLDKVNQLETKIADELEHIKEKMVRMDKELEKYTDLDGLKREWEITRKQQLADKVRFASHRDTYKVVLEHMTRFYDSKKQQLAENETHIQLGNLEQKLRHHEQSNFTLKQYIQTKTREADYQPVLEDVNSMVGTYNQMLVEALKHSSSGAI
eukprot:Opistho-2@3226